MHLKKLIISGFKSFADKVVLHFDEGITGIVGPNGSGKSNVIDAVRWIMGEQNAKNLRGKIATDIIFAGSAKRPALNMAEVTLVFDNSDFSQLCPPEYRHEAEISLTRRLFKDGEREYWINKKPCRYKDILTFFATSGLGGRSYSMIQQGQVERILNAKPEDVREILEEAAGTAVFKARAQAAQKKLESTQENLSRIDDILKELERGLTSLEGQVEKAKEWKQLSTQMREKELRLFEYGYVINRDKQAILQSQIDEETDKEVEYLTQIAQLEVRQVELRSLLDEANPELEELREKITCLREQSGRAEATITASKAAIENGLKRLEEIENAVGMENSELKSAEQAAEDAEHKMSVVQSDLVALREILASFEDEVEGAKEAYDVYRGRIDDLEEEIKNIDRLLLSNATKGEGIERERKRTQQDMTECQKRLALLEQEIAKLDEQIKEKGAAAALHQEGLDKHIAQKQSREQAIQSRLKEMEGHQAARDVIKEEYLSLKARYTSLEELLSVSSDIGNNLAKLKEGHPQTAALIQGLLTDYIGFNKSLSELPGTTVSAFEVWAEKIVIEDFNGLSEIARWAHKLKLGTMPVMVMAHEVVVDQAAVKKWAAEFDATPMKRYLKVVKQLPFIEKLTERIYYLPALRMSRADLAAIPGGLVVFSGQGVIISGADELCVGSRGVSGLLTKKVEMEDLAGVVKEKERHLARTQNALDHLESLQNEDRVTVREVDDILRQQNQASMEIMREYEAVSGQMQNKMQLMEDAATQYAKVEELHFSLAKELEVLGQSRIALGQDRDSVEHDLVEIKEEALSAPERNEEIQKQFHQKTVDLAKLEARSQGAMDAHIAAKNRLERVQQALNRRYDERSRVEAQIEQAKIDETQCHNEIAQYLGQKDELEKFVLAKKEQNSGTLEEIRDIESRIKSYYDKRMDAEKRVSKKGGELERLRGNVENYKQQALEKYQVDLTLYQGKCESGFSQEKAAAEIADIRLKIEKIGNVNMIAIEEYEKAFQRHEFILAQREEVVGSIALLADAISEIQETAKERFMHMFAIIDANFRELFPILFPGGEGRLQLTSESDPLNGGVDIFVRLPGKKTQHMDLFSGGEKALTAISLIFALLKTKPTPFCFLDEVDAPLDEANVGRYNNVLEALADKFQFIIITHNRRTMEVLDHWWGITMQEGGVSRVVGVDLKKDLPEHLQKSFKQEPQGRTLEGATAS